MQDLIERRAALTALCEDCLQKYEGICPHPASRCVEFRTIKQLPAIDAEPVRHGRWIEHGGGFVVTCSNCNATYRKDVLQSLSPYAEHLTRHCPNCGARMDGGADNGSDEN